ncbi:MAG: nucleotidyltransferase domain-containing protein [Microthrixaceae bacterium]|nr:nucleotidyltransferase domain-containing protein [Microthrixaceae bacterium]
MNLGRPFAVVTPTLDGDVLQVLAGAKASFTAPQVHRLVEGWSESGVRRTLHRLVEQGIVRSDTVGRTAAYRLNRRHLAADHVIGIAQLRVRLLEAIAVEVDGWDPWPSGVALFGSAATGAMTTKSDIDVFVVRPVGTRGEEMPMSEADDERWEGQVAELSRLIGEWTGNDARVLVFTDREVFSAARSGAPLEPVLADIAEHGIWVVGSSADLRPESTAG